MNLLKKYICELVLVINLFLILPMHDFNIWWNKPVINDAFGYYAYLPAAFIYNDFNYNFMAPVMQKHYQAIVKTADAKEAFVVKFKGREVNKYPPGVAYYQAPFFFMAHMFARAGGLEADGYSTIYMVFLCIGSIFWQYIFLKLILRILSFYSISAVASALTIPLISLGTNVFFYTQVFGTYSHLFSMLSITIFFYGGLRFFNSEINSNSVRYFFLFTIGYALTIVTRNVNAICILLLPCMGFKLSAIKIYLQFLKNKFALISLLVSISIVFLMLRLWHLQTGHWLINSYQGEHFNWGDPQVFKSLFSAQKGWFFYTPLAALALTGLYFTPKNFKLNISLFLVLIIYITSSWYCWDYGSGFSMRAYIDWYVILAICLGFLIDHFLEKKILMNLLLFLCITFSALNLLFSVQFYRGIISGHSQGIESFTQHFFRLRPILEFKQSNKSILERKLIFENFDSNTLQSSVEVNEKTPFSQHLESKFPDFFIAEINYKIRFGADVTMMDKNNDVFLCASVINEKDSTLFWHQVRINDFVLVNETEKVESGFDYPLNLPVNNRLRVFLWEPKGNTVCKIDNLYMEFMKTGAD